MNNLNGRRIWVLLLIPAAACVLVHLLQHNWTLRARFNLLLQGHAFCHLESPDQSNEPPFPPPVGFVYKLVYKNGVYIGYLNRSADFRTASDTTDPGLLNNRIMATPVVLFYLKWLFFTVSVLAGMTLIWQVYKERYGPRANSSSQPEIVPTS